MPELRTPVMILVDVSWQEGGIVQKSRACMEDKSAGGARIRMKTAIAAGSPLSVRWRFEEFAGIAKYCRREGREYVVGVQRQDGSDSGASGVETASGRMSSADEGAKASPRESSTVAQNPAVESGGDLEVRKELRKRADVNPLLQSASLMQLPAPRAIRSETARDEFARRQLTGRQLSVRSRFRSSGREEPAASREDERGRKKDSGQKATDWERKPMAHKWLGLSPWHSKEDDPAANGKDANENGITDEAQNHETSKSASAKENRMPMSQPGQNVEKIATISAREVPAFQVELLPMEDIYRTAGIVSPRKGYSVIKVVEMLNSEHIRGLSKETKRAALLMSLDAAGVTIEQVQRDAKSRQSALDSYETEQKKQAEAEWARKAEEITHIQAELESIKAHYTARISRNMEALARDKARFNSWVTTKEQEAQSMAEAVELCLKLPGSEPVASREREMTAAAAGATAAVVAAKPV